MGFKIRQRTRLDADEQPVLDIRRHGFILFERLLAPLIVWSVPILMALVGLLLTRNENWWNFGMAMIDISSKMFLLAAFFVLPWIGYVVYDWYNDSFHVTTKRVVRFEQVFIFSMNRTEARLTQIQNVGLKMPNMIANILDFGTVVIETASFSGGIEFDGVGSPRMIQETIFKLRGVTPPVLARHPRRSFHGIGDFVRYFLPFWPINEPDGSVVYHKHWWILLKVQMVPIIFLLIVGILHATFGNPLLVLLYPVVFGIIWFQYANWVNDIYILTEDKIIDIYRIPLIKEDRRVALLEQIQNTRVDIPNFGSRILDMGNVVVETAGKAQNFLFLTVHHPNAIADELQRRLEAVRTGRRQSERQSRQQEVEEMVNNILVRQQGSAPPPGAAPPS